ncbi:hypothetical protein ACHBHL_04610 [Streptococcus sp. A27]|uniref:hypothetical protein n=1 Tax=unclassified Streptococcus TaxID=2608887 RepID=UPI00374CEB17
MIKIIKIDSKKLFYLLLILSCSAIYGLNYWFSDVYTTDFMVISAMIVSVFSVLLHHKINLGTYYILPILLNLLMWISGIIVAFEHELQLSTILKESFFTIAPVIIYISYHSIIRNKYNIVSFLKLITISSVICNLISMLGFAFALYGADLLKINVFAKMRNGTPRFIIGEVIIILAFFLSYSILINSNKNILNNKLHLANVVLTLFNLEFIIKTRTLSLYVLITILVVSLFNKQLSRKVKIFIAIIFLFSLITVINSNIMYWVEDTINNDYGIQMRFYEIEYYVNYFKNNWIAGVGFLSSSSNSSTYNVVMGPYGKYYTSDVGIIGLLFKNGIIGLFWIFSWFYTSIKILLKNMKFIPNYYSMFMKMIVVFYLISCINLIFTDTPRFPYIALGMIIIESSGFFIE